MVTSVTTTAKTIVITGANSGIGFETAFHFARLGARVVMACRSPDKAASAKDQILAEVPNANLLVLPLDVSSLDSVREFARLFAEQVGQLDVLINNAGIALVEMGRNKDGHELQLATNYLGMFALTGLLLPFFNNEGLCRIVNISSLAHRTGKINLDDLNWETGEYTPWKGYANSKVAGMSYTMELNRRLADVNHNIIAVGAHPGFANTNINKGSATLSETKGLRKWMQTKLQSKIPTAEQAAQAMILAAEGSDVKGGDYYGPGGFMEIGGKPGKAKINPLAKDTELGKKLWQVSEQMTGVSFLSEA